MDFKIVSEIDSLETIAEGTGIRDLNRLKKAYGGKKWRKMKGISNVEFPSGNIVRAEIHWYEAHGIGKKELKIKQLID